MYQFDILYTKVHNYALRQYILIVNKQIYKFYGKKLEWDEYFILDNDNLTFLWR